MRAVVFLLIIAIIFACMYTVLKMMERRTLRSQAGHARWHISPRTDENNNAKTIWLVCAGERDFLYWPTPDNAGWDWDRASMEAEAECTNLNRMKKELHR